MSDHLMSDIINRSGNNNLFAAIRELDSSVYRKYKGQDLNDKKIVIWRNGGMGDLCFIAPYLKKIKELYPRCHITFGCAIQYSDVMKDHPSIDVFENMPLDTDILKEADYHLMFEGIIENNTRAETVNAYDLFGEYFCIKLNDDEKIPYLTVDKNNLEYFKNIEKNFIKIDKPLKIGIHLKTSSIIRDIPHEVWNDIVRELLSFSNRICLYFIGSEDDLGVMNKIVFPQSSVGRVMPFCSNTRGFKDSVAAISEMDCMLGGDSSGVHIAAAFKIPIVAMFGAFTPEVRVKYYENTFGLHAKIKCSPCFQHGSNPCDYSDFRGNSLCMKIFDPTAVVEKISVLLAIKEKIRIRDLSPKASIKTLALYREFGREKNFLDKKQEEESTN